MLRILLIIQIFGIKHLRILQKLLLVKLML